MKIQILFQYHNNMYDTVKALETIAAVEFLSYRTSKLVLDITARQPIVFGRSWKTYVPWNLWRLLDANASAVILKHLNDPINFWPYVLCWLKHIPCVVIVQRPTVRSFFGYAALFRLLAWILRHAGVKVMSVTHEGRRWLQPYRLNVTYIPACIDARRFQPHILGEHDFLPTRLRLLTVAKFQRRKHIPLLITAVATLTKLYPTIDFSLTVVGNLSDTPSSIAEFKRVQACMAQSGLAAHVTLKVNVPYEKMAAMYGAADAFILAAEDEPLGYAIVEAMAARLPIFCSSEVGAASYVDPGQNGYVFAPRSSAAVTKAVSRVITPHGTVNTEMLTRLGHASHKKIQREHSPTAFLHAFRTVLDS